MSESGYLKGVLESHRMKHVEGLVAKFEGRQSEIKEAIEEHYSDDTYGCFSSGSFAKHTATNIKFDLDMVVPFKKARFSTLQEMFDDVYRFLNEKYGSVASIRKQKVSIGIVFHADIDGDRVEIDVVPGRELNPNDYQASHDLNLYFNEDHWGFQKGTCQKTNIERQIEHIKGKDGAREIIRLLKIWKKQRGKEYKSFVIELAVIKALENYDGNSGLWPRLKFVMEYLRDHIAEENFRLMDPGNSGNNVVLAMQECTRLAFQSDMRFMLDNINSNPEQYLSYYFKVNEKYSGYEVKETGKSYPTTPKRFG